MIKIVNHEEGDFVKFVFYYEPDVSSYKNEEEGIIAFIQTHSSVTAQQVASYVSVSHNTAIRKLGNLIKAKKIIVRRTTEVKAIRMVEFVKSKLHALLNSIDF